VRQRTPLLELVPEQATFRRQITPQLLKRAV